MFQVSYHRRLLICLGLSLVILVAYWQVRNHSFLTYDDHEYVVGNPYVTPGITWEGIRWAFTSVRASNWHPLTWISHMADCQLYGLNPSGHHWTSVILHIANTILLFLAISRMTRKEWEAGFVALMFGIHPLHVESVAWVAERKDVLSTLFFLLTILAHYAYVRSPTLKRYALGILLFIMGLLAKPMLVTLPFVLLLLDWWPLGRIGIHARTCPRKGDLPPCPAGGSEASRAPALGIFVKHKKNSSPSKGEDRGGGTKAALYPLPPYQVRGRLLPLPPGEGNSENAIPPWQATGSAPLAARVHPVWEKIPHLAISAIVSVATFKVQAASGSVQSIGVLPLETRLANAVVSYTGYIEKMFWPANLASFYPHPVDTIPAWRIILALCVIISVTILVIYAVRSRPYLLMGWLWYMGTLVPTIGLVQVGEQAMADRYTYIPLIGLFIMCSWLIADLAGRWRISKTLLSLTAGLLTFCVLVVTSRQVSHWKDTVTLFEHEIRVTENNFLAHFHLGATLAQEGRIEEAVSQFSEAVRIRPDYSPAYYHMGNAYSRQGKLDEAIASYSKALKKQPHDPKILNNMGFALLQKGKVEAAAHHFSEALMIDPADRMARHNLGIALQRMEGTGRER